MAQHSIPRMPCEFDTSSPLDYFEELLAQVRRREKSAHLEPVQAQLLRARLAAAAAPALWPALRELSDNKYPAPVTAIACAAVATVEKP